MPAGCAPHGSFLSALPLCPAQMLEAFDTDKDGIVSKAEFERGMKLMRLRYADTLEINIDKLTTRLMFEDEKTTCGAAACLFFMFSALYIVVLTLQFDPGNSYKVTKGMTDFVTGIDGYEDISSGEDLMGWAKDSLVPAIFGAEKYNGEKLALWERNYMVGHNKLIGGVFLMQTRGERWDKRTGLAESKATGETYGSCSGKFSLFCTSPPPRLPRVRLAEAQPRNRC